MVHVDAGTVQRSHSCGSPLHEACDRWIAFAGATVGERCFNLYMHLCTGDHLLLLLICPSFCVQFFFGRLLCCFLLHCSAALYSIESFCVFKYLHGTLSLTVAHPPQLVRICHGNTRFGIRCLALTRLARPPDHHVRSLKTSWQRDAWLRRYLIRLRTRCQEPLSK